MPNYKITAYRYERYNLTRKIEAANAQEALLKAKTLAESGDLEKGGSLSEFVQSCPFDYFTAENEAQGYDGADLQLDIDPREG